MPLPLIPLAVGALMGRAGKKKEGKEQFVAVKGRTRKDGSVWKARNQKEAKIEIAPPLVRDAASPSRRWRFAR